MIKVAAALLLLISTSHSMVLEVSRIPTPSTTPPIATLTDRTTVGTLSIPNIGLGTIGT